VISEAGGGDLSSGVLLLELQIRDFLARTEATLNRRFKAIINGENGDHP
jgi:hypothetical protein